MAKKQEDQVLNNEDDQTPGKTSSSRKSKKSRKGSTSALKKELEEMTKQHDELKDKYLRLFAEFDNFKKRTVKEKLEMLRSAGEDTIVDLLPVLDDFDRAKKSADDENTEEQFSEGVSLVYNRLNTILQNKGLKVMETEEVDFDPELHEAITELPAATEDLKGKIIDTIERGYFLNDKIIRHAKVVVAK